jgi:hypothetical protein
VVSTNPVLSCFINPKGLNYEDLLEGIIPELDELANGLRLNTEVPSQDMSGALVTIRWVAASQGTCLSIGLDRGIAPPNQIRSWRFHASSPGNPRRKPGQLDGIPQRGVKETTRSKLRYDA